MSEKTKLGAKGFLYPMPIVLIGADVDGRANFTTIAYCAIVQKKPAMIAVSLYKEHHTCKGIRKNKTFSVNIPSEKLVVQTDHCGLVSGKNTDKSKVFKVFYGKLKTAPMIFECPINLECALVKTVKLDEEDLFVGLIKESYAEDRFLTNGVPDIKKIRPLVYATKTSSYFSIGRFVAKAYEIGKKYKK